MGENKRTPGESSKNKLNARFGKNWWGWEKWWGEQSNSEVFRWMNQDGMIEIENNESQPIKTTLKLRLVPALPKTTVDVYLNKTLIGMIEVKAKLTVYSIDCQLKPGNNQLILHVREGTFQPPKDSRKIALGLIGETTGIVGENTIQVQLGKNWWDLEKWSGDQSDSTVLRWMNQNGTVKIENNLHQPVKTSLRFKFIPILPKTTVDVYLNNKLIETLEVKEFKFYSVDCQLKPGDNQLLFYVREGTLKVPGDKRSFAVGVNAIRFADGL
jgi:DNA-binding XRE family transcriptional regulator